MCDLDPRSLQSPLMSGACFIVWRSVSNSKVWDEKCRLIGAAQLTLKMGVSTNC